MLFLYDKSLVSTADLERTIADLGPVFELITGVRSTGYDDAAGFVNVPFDTAYHDAIYALANEKKKLKVKLLLLIGIGGSNLGTLAVYEALFGRSCNQDESLQLLCMDTLDADKMHQGMQRVAKLLQQGENVLITVVTKSGTTTETTINAAFFIDLLKKHRPDNYQKYIVMITDKNSPLWHLSEQSGYDRLEIPKNVGGRYSVFSAVGLFPLALMGVDTKSLCEGVREAVTDSLQKNEKNNAATSAALLFSHYQNGTKIHDTFLFDDALESLGKWYRQLMAESLGKNNQGMLPTVSMGTVDLHSMAQFYLGGPRMSFTTFIATHSEHDFIVPDSTLSQATGSSVVTIEHAILEGVQAAYEQAKLPFVTVADFKKDAQTIGYFLQFKMLEIVYLGFLMQVNPFDQPHVELYKKEVRKRLQ